MELSHIPFISLAVALATQHFVNRHCKILKQSELEVDSLVNNMKAGVTASFIAIVFEYSGNWRYINILGFLIEAYSVEEFMRQKVRPFHPELHVQLRRQSTTIYLESLGVFVAIFVLLYLARLLLSA
jgi:hypothetical protein